VIADSLTPDAETKGERIAYFALRTNVESVTDDAI
jgi:hypothetical protein